MDQHVATEPSGQPDLLGEVLRIQAGDDNLRNAVITRYIPFIKARVARVLGRFADERDDEFSIGLGAFNEALDRFDASRQTSFLGFASLVINRRVIDEIRRTRRERSALPFSYLEAADDEEFGNRLVAEDPTFLYEYVEVEEDILSFQNQLALRGLSLSGLMSDIPSHIDTKRLCIRMARHLVDDPAFQDRFAADGSFSNADLARAVGVSTRTVERNRTFVRFLGLILRSDLDTLKFYIGLTEKGGVSP